MNMQSSFVKERIDASAQIKLKMAESEVVEAIKRAAEYVVQALRSGGKVLLCGNGGSAADSQHIAAELVARLRKERRAIPALALSTNTSTLTALANDYDFSKVFVRQVEAFGSPGDVLIGISTSGNSENVLKAMVFAKQQGLKTVALTGGSGGKMAAVADLSIIVPSTSVQRIQEVHITVGHILCDLIEQSLNNQ